MKHLFLSAILCVTVSASIAGAQDELLDKIKLLEQQIQELKSLKEQQDINKIKSEQCMKAIFREKFCTCIGNSLPYEVSFEQYVHTLATPKNELGYSSMTSEQKLIMDATINARENCIEKGFFK